MSVMLTLIFYTLVFNHFRLTEIERIKLNKFCYWSGHLIKLEAHKSFVELSA